MRLARGCLKHRITRCCCRTNFPQGTTLPPSAIGTEPKLGKERELVSQKFGYLKSIFDPPLLFHLMKVKTFNRDV